MPITNVVKKIIHTHLLKIYIHTYQFKSLDIIGG